MSVGSVVTATKTVSSGDLWYTFACHTAEQLPHSSQWVLPPRPKPGRKSKKANDSDDVEDADVAADKVGLTVRSIVSTSLLSFIFTQSASRTKQKASRERKQEYIAELEAKVRQYEQGDGEKAALFQVCIAFPSICRFTHPSTRRHSPKSTPPRTRS